MGKFIDLAGQRFGMLTVIERVPDRTTGVKPCVMWLCRCDCGSIKAVSGSSLRGCTTVSCGCKKITHHRANKERLYNTWKCMRQRCHNPNNPSYPHYGGKGVKICEDWQEYIGFRTWALSNGYSDELSIDRIDVNGDYCPENCRWVDDKVQMNNQSRNRKIFFDGKQYTMSQLADKLGLSYSAIQHRIERGWDIDRIAHQKQRRSAVRR